jgi:hypothetical protein
VAVTEDHASIYTGTSRNLIITDVADLLLWIISIGIHSHYSQFVTHNVKEKLHTLIKTRRLSEMKLQCFVIYW